MDTADAVRDEWGLEASIARVKNRLDHGTRYRLADDMRDFAHLLRRVEALEEAAASLPPDPGRAPTPETRVAPVGLAAHQVGNTPLRSEEMTMSGDISKLPKWAQQYIEVLERNLQDMTRQRDELLPDGPEDSDTVIRRHWTDDLRLPKGASITFQVGPDPRDQITVRAGEEGLHVNGDGGLLIRPSASNAVTMTVQRRARKGAQA